MINISVVLYNHPEIGLLKGLIFVESFAGENLWTLELHHPVDGLVESISAFNQEDLQVRIESYCRKSGMKVFSLED